MSEFNDFSQPVECYTFKLDGVGTVRYTTDELRVIAEGKPHTSIPGLSRSSIQIVTAGESAEMSISVPASSWISQRLAMFDTPPKTTLAFRRYQRNDLNTPTMQFDGVLAGASISDEITTLKFPDVMQNALAGIIPKRKTLQTCNWIFGDSNCKVDPSQYRVTFAGADVSPLNDVRSYLVYVPGAEPVIFRAKLGILKMTTGSDVDYRTVNDAYGTSAYGGSNFTSFVITVNEPFVFNSATQFELNAGCDYSKSMCSEYQNLPNYGGFPYMPTEKSNPFRIRLDRPKRV